jgi:hypothetical protein
MQISENLSYWISAMPAKQFRLYMEKSIYTSRKPSFIVDQYGWTLVLLDNYNKGLHIEL